MEFNDRMWDGVRLCCEAMIARLALKNYDCWRLSWAWSVRTFFFPALSIFTCLNVWHWGSRCRRTTRRKEGKDRKVQKRKAYISNCTLHVSLPRNITNFLPLFQHGIPTISTIGKLRNLSLKTTNSLSQRNLRSQLYFLNIERTISRKFGLTSLVLLTKL